MYHLRRTSVIDVTNAYMCHIRFERAHVERQTEMTDMAIILLLSIDSCITRYSKYLELK